MKLISDEALEKMLEVIDIYHRDDEEMRDGKRPTVQARVKPLALPEAPKYEANTGKPLDSDIEVEYAPDGSVLRAQRVSVHGLALGTWHRHRS